MELESDGEAEGVEPLEGEAEGAVGVPGVGVMGLPELAAAVDAYELVV